MNIRFILQEEDYLQHELFVASENKLFKFSSSKILGVYLAVSAISGYYLYTQNHLTVALISIVVGGVIIMALPRLVRGYYKNEITKYVQNTFGNSSGKEIECEFFMDNMLMGDGERAATIAYNQIENVTETSDYFYAKVQSSSHIIIPKVGIGNARPVKQRLLNICEESKIPYYEQLDWTW